MSMHPPLVPLAIAAAAMGLSGAGAVLSVLCMTWLLGSSFPGIPNPLLRRWSGPKQPADATTRRKRVPGLDAVRANLVWLHCLLTLFGSANYAAMAYLLVFGPTTALIPCRALVLVFIFPIPSIVTINASRRYAAVAATDKAWQRRFVGACTSLALVVLAVQAGSGVFTLVEMAGRMDPAVLAEGPAYPRWAMYLTILLPVTLATATVKSLAVAFEDPVPVPAPRPLGQTSSASRLVSALSSSTLTLNLSRSLVGRSGLLSPLPTTPTDPAPPPPPLPALPRRRVAVLQESLTLSYRSTTLIFITLWTCWFGAYLLPVPLILRQGLIVFLAALTAVAELCFDYVVRRDHRRTQAIRRKMRAGDGHPESVAMTMAEFAPPAAAAVGMVGMGGVE
ncbi:hypothetical protein H9P43_006625 [Blastocladiella emersonii ATCC 22665]|nr:hypothetical protein H9P43_006625 [Blastocladiella emersonii ATCC 22665]